MPVYTYTTLDDPLATDVADSRPNTAATCFIDLNRAKNAWCARRRASGT